MAFLEDAALRARQSAQTPAGQPNLSKNSAGPGSAMGTVQPSRPAGPPPSPGVNRGTVGRPPAPRPAAGVAPYPSAPQLTQTPSPPKPQPMAQAAAPAAPAQPGALAAPMTPQALPPRKFQGMPRSREMRDLQPGEMAESPWGPVTMDEKGEPKIQFTPEGEMAYRKAVVAARKKFGPFTGMNDPNAPQPPIQPGQEWFNPRTGKWTQV